MTDLRTFIDESRQILNFNRLLQTPQTSTTTEQELIKLRKEKAELKKRNEDLQIIIESKAPPIIRANGADSLARSYKMLKNRVRVLDDYLVLNKETKRKAEYTTYPLKREEFKFFTKTLRRFEEHFAPHMPAINHILDNPPLTQAKRKAKEEELELEKNKVVKKKSKKEKRKNK